MIQFDLRKLFGQQNVARRLAGLDLRPDLAAAAVKMVSDERSDEQIVGLESELDAAESVVILVEGLDGGRLGFLALTTERVLFRAHGSTAGGIVSTPLAAISKVEDRARGRYGRVVLHLPGRTLQVDEILGVGAAQFAQAVRRRLAGTDQVPHRDPMRELSDLRELRAAGVSVLLVEQKAQAALQIADRAYVMELGEFILNGPAKDIASNARVVASYLGFQHEGQSGI